MTKQDIVRNVAEQTGHSLDQVQLVVQRTIDTIISTLVADRRLELRHFGVFEVKTRAPRRSRNPRTGETIFVPEKNTVKFKPGFEFSQRVRKGKSPAVPSGETVRLCEQLRQS